MMLTNIFFFFLELLFPVFLLPKKIKLIKINQLEIINVDFITANIKLLASSGASWCLCSAKGKETSLCNITGKSFSREMNELYRF